MQKGFTLLESLIALLVISVLLTLALPTWQHYRQQSILQKEQQKLYIFLRQIQARVENSSDIWFLIANRHQTTGLDVGVSRRKLSTINYVIA